MFDFSYDTYMWIKTLHIISVITWMAGLFYLPRLFVYHAQVDPESEMSQTFKIMEQRLLRGIMHPSLVVVLVTAALMFPSWLDSGWLHVKTTLVLGLVGCHFLYAKWRNDFNADKNKHGHRFYRYWNEAPTVLLLGIIPLVVFKWF